MHIEQSYLQLLEDIRAKGYRKENRTGIDTLVLPYPTMIQHDMSLGFPLLTTKKLGLKNIAAELEMFIKGITDKKWLQDRNCHIWDEWCNPTALSPGNSPEDCNDLGPVYGYQWTQFNGLYIPGTPNTEPAIPGHSDGFNQLLDIVEKLKTNPNDRRMICSAWNPLQLHMMALPACHVMWGVQIVDGKLNVWWAQRSVDTFIGLPYNIASYAMLLKLLCEESGFQEGILTGFLVDVHIYENHLDQVTEQLSRKPYELPSVTIESFKSIFDWQYTDFTLHNYQCHPSIKGAVAV